MIDGVVITPLKQIRDERGAVFHMLRSDAPHFAGFGEIYFSIINPGITKGWKRHTEMVMGLCVPQGKIRLVLIDERVGSNSYGTVQEIKLSENPEDYKLVTVPAGVWSAFSCLGETSALLANCASILHRPDEAENRDLNSPPLPFVW